MKKKICVARKFVCGAWSSHICTNPSRIYDNGEELSSGSRGIAVTIYRKVFTEVRIDKKYITLKKYVLWNCKINFSVGARILILKMKNPSFHLSICWGKNTILSTQNAQNVRTNYAHAKDAVWQKKKKEKKIVCLAFKVSYLHNLQSFHSLNFLWFYTFPFSSSLYHYLSLSVCVMHFESE